MECKPLTIEEILETLTPDEKEEVLQDNFKIPLQLYLDGYNRNPAVPRESLLRRFRSYARVRASVKRAVEENPEILRIQIEEPVFIIGMARTGTTMLHRLLAADNESFSAPMLWELTEPTPPRRPYHYKTDERYLKAFDDEDSGMMVSRFLDKRHYVRMDSPEECFMAMRPYFMNSNDFTQILDLPELREFMYHFPEQQALETYQYYKKCLQCIFYDGMWYLPEGNRLLLKCPIHCLNLSTIKKVFPDAKFLFPIRNMKTTVTSFCTLIHQIWMETDKDADAHACGRRVLENYKYKSENAVKFFKQAPKDCYLPISYSQMTSNPIKKMDEIYSYFGWVYNSDTEELWQRHIQKDKHHKFGKVKKVDLAEEYGVTDADLKEHLKDFFEYFADGPEKLM